MIGNFIGAPIGGVTGFAISVVEAAGAAAGSSTVTGVGASTASAAGSIAGIAAVSGVGRSTASVAGSSAGVAIVAATGITIIPIAGAAAGVAEVLGVGNPRFIATGSAAGTSTVRGFWDSTPITSDNVLQLPINCILAGQQHYKDRGRTWDIPPARTTAKAIATGSSVRRMRGPAPSFTTRTGKRGYD